MLIFCGGAKDFLHVRRTFLCKKYSEVTRKLIFLRRIFQLAFLWAFCKSNSFSFACKLFIKRMWLFNGQFLKSCPFDEKECACIPNAMLIGIAHKNEIDGVSQRTINTRLAKKAHLKNFGATNVKQTFRTAAKDQQSDCDGLSEDCSQKTLITTFAAKEEIPKGNVVSFGAAFFGTFFAEAKKVRVPSKAKL